MRQDKNALMTWKIVDQCDSELENKTEGKLTGLDNTKVNNTILQTFK